MISNTGKKSGKKSTKKKQRRENKHIERYMINYSTCRHSLRDDGIGNRKDRKIFWRNTMKDL